MSLVANYKAHTQERAELGVPPLALTAEQVAQLVELLKADKIEEEAYLLDLLKNRIPAGVDDAAYVKAAFLNAIVHEDAHSHAIDRVEAVKILGKMLGGFNVGPLIDGLRNNNVAIAQEAADQLKNTILVYADFDVVKELMDHGNPFAKQVIESWAEAQWFTNKSPMKSELTVTVYKIPGETNTDDLSPAGEAFTRADIPLHANSFLVNRMENPLQTMEELKAKGHPLAYVGDVVGTGSSRKSGINSVQWHMGVDIDGIPNKKTGGIVIGDIIAPIFFQYC